MFCSLCLAETTPEQANVERLELAVEADPDNLDLRYDLGLAYNDLAVLAEEDENEEALEQATETFIYIYEQDPNRLEAKAMLGSAYVLRARFSSIFTKIKWAEKGFDVLDEVIVERPEDAALRLIRAANSAQVPGFLGRGDEAREDFAWLLARIESHPNDFYDGLRRSVYYYAGEYALKKDDKSSIELLIKAKETPGEARLDHLINEKLEAARKAFPNTGDS